MRGLAGQAIQAELWQTQRFTLVKSGRLKGGCHCLTGWVRLLPSLLAMLEHVGNCKVHWRVALFIGGLLCVVGLDLGEALDFSCLYANLSAVDKK